jgi:predicted RNA methylase
MAAWPCERRFGVEIDPDQVDAGDYTALRGDLQRLYPLMRLAGVRFPAVVCNPPFGLDWQDPASGRTVNSTALLPALRARASRGPRPGPPDCWA